MKSSTADNSNTDSNTVQSDGKRVCRQDVYPSATKLFTALCFYRDMHHQGSLPGLEENDDAHPHCFTNYEPSVLIPRKIMTLTHCACYMYLQEKIDSYL